MYYSEHNVVYIPVKDHSSLGVQLLFLDLSLNRPPDFDAAPFDIAQDS